MHNELRLTAELVALEAHISLDLVGLMKNTLPSIVSGFSNLVGRFSPTEPPIPLTSREQDFLKEVQKHPYLDMVPLAAYVPEGLKVTYVEYAAALLPAADHAVKVSTSALNNFAVLLAQLVSNHSSRISTTSLERELQTIAARRTRLNKDMGACFLPGSTRSERTYGDVVARNSDWPVVFRDTDILSKQINSIDRKQLDKKIEECVTHLNTIKRQIESGEVKDASSQTVQNLSDSAYAVAQEVEFIAAVYYKTLAFNQAVNRTMDHVRDVFSI